MVRLITREEILATELIRERVSVPEWGGDVFVKEMSGVETDEWELAVVNDRMNARAITVIHCIVAEDGNRIFKDDDAAALGQKSGRAMSRITDVWRRLNKAAEADMETAKGNSEPDRSGDSASP